MPGPVRHQRADQPATVVVVPTKSQYMPWPGTVPVMRITYMAWPLTVMSTAAVPSASVVASILCVVVAMEAGFSAVGLLALATYALGGFAALAGARTEGA